MSRLQGDVRESGCHTTAAQVAAPSGYGEAARGVSGTILSQVSFPRQVNAGPMAYARAFLEETNAKKYPDNQVKLLKEIFR